MPNLLQACAINEVFPEGMKTIAFALEYDAGVTPAWLGAVRFEVIDHSYEPKIPPQKRTIQSIYINDRPAVSGSGQASGEGRYVILGTDTEETAAFAIGNYKMDGTFNPYGHPPVGFPDPDDPGPGGPGGKGPGGKGPGGGPPPDMEYCGPKPLNVTIRQIPAEGDVAGAEGLCGGCVIMPQEVSCTTYVCRQFEGFEERSLKGLPYQLYVPQPYDPSVRYPLVLFIPDAGGRGENPLTPLAQGIGGVCWASAEDQGRHPCFIVCPAFGPKEILVDDEFRFSEKLYLSKEILDQVAAEYSIDTDRIYTTGQSMGCMSSCQLMIDFPGYFAGAVLVAGQWDPAKCGKAMKDQNLWILVSENDRKAHAGMDAVTAAIEENGGRVVRRVWNARDAVPELDLCARELRAAAEAEGANVRYVMFEGDSVVPEGIHPGPGNNHTNTWRVAYQIDEVRDWLFTARRPGAAASGKAPAQAEPKGASADAAAAGQEDISGAPAAETACCAGKSRTVTPAAG